MENYPKYPIHINAFEAGMLTSMIYDYCQKRPDKALYLQGVFDQLRKLQEEFRKKAGSKIEDLGNNMIRITDGDGDVITRERYPWEG